MQDIIDLEINLNLLEIFLVAPVSSDVGYADTGGLY